MGQFEEEDLLLHLGSEGEQVHEVGTRWVKPIWRDMSAKSANSPRSSNAYQARAHKRAALIVLSLQHPRDGWPAPLTHQWKLQFREGWHQSENARGRKDLMKRLGMDEKDEHLAGWLLRWLRGVWVGAVSDATLGALHPK